uniref:Uncharacterized protein n=1 Tax=Kalmanozyma brasiliensis (strain GHG001) TaxID=1365824 RepID=V5ERN1_KALBG
MPSQIALSIGLLAAAIGMVNAVPHHEFKRANYAVCRKYVASYNGGHNVYAVNENKGIDASGANIGLNLLSLDGQTHKSWDNVPRYCLKYIKQYNGGHNLVVDNQNKVIDLSNLNFGVDILKRDEDDGGYNTYASNRNEVIDVSDLLADVNILRRSAPSFSHPTLGKRDDVASNTNEIIDASHLSALIEALTKRDYDDGGNNVEAINENKVVDLSDLSALVNVLSQRSVRGYGTQLNARDIPDSNQCGPDEVYVNQGHNVCVSNKNELIDLSNMTIHIGILDGLFGAKQTKKEVSATSTCGGKKGCCVPKSAYYYNGGHNTQVTNKNAGIDASGLNVGVDIL